jgi:hypothetical protein
VGTTTPVCYACILLHPRKRQLIEN